ncbi:MAG: type IV secretion system protein [Alphaproteobacteria bacterium]|nr:type IV secretion system protein [Alphaproteobacteria bacterium]
MGGQNENSSHDNAIGWAIMMVVLGVFIYIFWLLLDTEIRDLVRWWRYAQMWVVYGVFQLGELLGIYDGSYTIQFNGRTVPWEQGFSDVSRFEKKDLTYWHLSYFSQLSMQPLHYVYAAILGGMGIWALRSGPKTHFRQKLGLEGLIVRQSTNFPAIAPFVAFNPQKQPPRPPGSPVPAELPSFAEALGPEEWLAYYEIPVPDGKIDDAAAIRAFSLQLGARWGGWQRLAPYKQILLAAFCLKASRKRNDSDAMLGRLACCWSFQKGLVLSKDRALHRDALKVLKNKKLSEEVLSKANRHAYETTALLRALLTAREEGGVLAPAQFVWLRGFDRTLWYPMNNLGRQSFHLEAFGAMAHFKMERMTDRPIPVPKVEAAVEALKEYMGSRLARPIPPLDYSGSKKKAVKKAL